MYNKVADFDIVTNLLESQKEELSTKPEKFIDLFLLLCKSIDDLHNVPTTSIVDSFSNLGKILYMLDLGFEIVCNIALKSSDNTIQQRHIVSTCYSLAWLTIKQ